MRIAYVANVRFPTEKAHGVQIAKMCEAFADLGHEVELIVTDRATPISQDPFAYYGVRRNFTLTRIPVPDIVSWGAPGFIAEALIFGMRAARYLRRRDFELIYGRDESALFFVSKQFMWETHTGAWNLFARSVARKAYRIVAISQGLKDFYVANGVDSGKVVVAHDGIDLDQFAAPETKTAARARLGLPLDARIAMYIGRLDGWKGVDTLLEASKRLSGVLLVVIGGEPEQITLLQGRYPHVRFLGFHPYSELANNQAAADVLVLPNTGKDLISARYTSPLKLFAYMASGNPITVSDLPSIREVLHDSAAYFFTPDDAASLAQAIKNALGDQGARLKAQRARSIVERYTWAARARAIVDALKIRAASL